MAAGFQKWFRRLRHRQTLDDLAQDRNIPELVRSYFAQPRGMETTQRILGILGYGASASFLRACMAAGPLTQHRREIEAIAQAVGCMVPLQFLTLVSGDPGIAALSSASVELLLRAIAEGRDAEFIWRLAADIIGQIKTKSTVMALLKLVPNDDPRVMGSALYALWKLHDDLWKLRGTAPKYHDEFRDELRSHTELLDEAAATLCRLYPTKLKASMRENPKLLFWAEIAKNLTDPISGNIRITEWLETHRAA